MKMRRTLPHNLLVSECISQLRFHVRVRGERGEGEREREGVCVVMYNIVHISNYISDIQSFMFLLVYVCSMNVWDI